MGFALRLFLLFLTMAFAAAPDALGNVRSWTQGSTTGTVSYDATNRVSTDAKTGKPTRAFTYDARGNTAGNGDNTFVYDLANQPVTVGGAIPQTHVYDGNFKRVKTVENGKTVYQVFSRVTGSLVYRDEVTDGETTDYVNVGGAALRLKKAGATSTPEYVHFDHQGSALAATNASGAILWRERYSPWGTRLLKPAGNRGDTGYTGHLMDNTTELVYMQARYYDSQIGRFYPTDPIGYQDQLNLYAYVANDPVNATDPNGESAVTLAIKFALKGGDIASTFAGVVDDVKTLGDPSASGLSKAIAIVSLASEVVSPVSLKDAKAAGNAVQAAVSKGGKGGPDFVVTPKGEAIPVPDGASGPNPTINKGGNEAGFEFTGGSGGKGMDSKVDGVRIMDANKNQGPRVNFMNESRQTVDPASGRTISKDDPRGHIPLKEDQ